MPKGIKLSDEEKAKVDPYKYQKLNHLKNKEKRNKDCVRRTYVKKFEGTNEEFWSDERLKNYRKNKKALHNLKDIDLELLKYFLKYNDVNIDV